MSSNKTNTTLQNDNVYEFDKEEIYNEEQTEKSSEKSKGLKGFLFNFGSKRSTNKSKQSKVTSRESSDNSGKRQLANNEAVNNFLFTNKGEQNVKEEDASHLSGFSEVDNPF